jgi:adenylosuccinate synthase
VDEYTSGNWYTDQFETDWDELGIEPELTTVTKRIRRVATFSMNQFYDACYANDPNVVFVSHMDYLDRENQRNFMEDLNSARINMGKNFRFIGSFGPKVTDVRKEEQIYAV